MRIVSKEESISMTFQMLCPLGKKYGMMKLLYRALAHLFDVCKKIKYCRIKGTGL